MVARLYRDSTSGLRATAGVTSSRSRRVDAARSQEPSSTTLCRHAAAPVRHGPTADARHRPAAGRPRSSSGTIIGTSIFVQPSEITREVPTITGILLAWTLAGVLTFIGRARLRRAGVGVSADRRRLRIPARGVLHPRGVPVGLGQLLEHPLGHHRGHLDGVRPLHRVLRRAEPAAAAARGRGRRHRRHLGDQLRRACSDRHHRANGHHRRQAAGHRGAAGRRSWPSRAPAAATRGRSA